MTNKERIATGSHAVSILSKGGGIVAEIKDKRICYICSPYRGNIFKRIRNIRYARKLTRAAVKIGLTPITPHLYITQVLNDKNVMDRWVGLNIGIDLLRLCDIVIVGEAYGISDGMAGEIKVAESRNMEIWRI